MVTFVLNQTYNRYHSYCYLFFVVEEVSYWANNKDLSAAVETSKENLSVLQFFPIGHSGPSVTLLDWHV